MLYETRINLTLVSTMLCVILKQTQNNCTAKWSRLWTTQTFVFASFVEAIDSNLFMNK